MIKQLVDVRPVRLTLVEGMEGGKVRVRGEFARAGQATENKRIYPQKVWERQIGRLGKPMKERRVFGEIDHPLDGRTSLSRVSHIVTDMRLEDGVLVGEAEILPTDKGLNLMALLKSDCKVGVSSRGYGSTKPNEKGMEIVQEDYKLVTFDFVADPADQTAYPEVFFEGVEIDSMLTKEQEQQKAAEWAEMIKAMSDDGATADPDKTADELLTKIAEMRAQIREEVRGELLSDPQIAGARGALEQVKTILRPYCLPEDAEAVVKAKEAEISRLKKENVGLQGRIKDLETEKGKYEEAAKEAGYKLYLERQLAGDPDAALVKKLVGDVKKFESAETFKARLSEAREEMAKKREVERKRDEAKAREVERARSLVREVQEKAAAREASTTEAIDKLTSINHALILRVYAANKLRAHPNSAKIQKMIESAQPDSKEAIDEIIQSYAPSAPHDDDDASAVRSRIRKFTRGGSEGSPLDEETPRRARGDDDFNGLGVGIGELRRLSGVRK